MTQSELEKYLWGAATHLRGHIDAGDYKQYIFPLLFFKRISDVYDEEMAQALADSDGDLDYAAFAEHHRFQIPVGAHWRDVRAQTMNVGSALLGAMKKGKLGAKPSFFVCDEQHKFSVSQREQLIAGYTNSLEATATPMPLLCAA